MIILDFEDLWNEIISNHPENPETKKISKFIWKKFCEDILLMFFVLFKSTEPPAKYQNLTSSFAP